MKKEESKYTEEKLSYGRKKVKIAVAKLWRRMGKAESVLVMFGKR